MQIEKITDNKYLFYKEEENYILNIGAKKQGEDTTTELLFTEVDNPNEITLKAYCGCTTTDKKELSEESFSVKIAYKDCSPTFSKVVGVMRKNKEIFKIKIKGTCHR